MSELPRESDSTDLTAEQCMFRAYDALRGAGERFAKRGLDDLAAAAYGFADGVADLDPRDRDNA